jgi:glucose-6-phosphate isomerase
MPDYRRRAVRENMTVRLDVNGMMAEAIGEAGLSRAEVDAFASRAADTARILGRRRQAGEIPFLDLHRDSQTLKQVVELAGKLRDEVDTLVVIGAGASSLGPRAILGALGAASKLRIIVADSVDPGSFGAVLDGIDPARTVFNVISCSGDTMETVAQFLVVRDRVMRALGAIDYKHRVVITTDAAEGTLRQIVNDEGFHDLPVPAGLSAAFGVLGAVGLFPAAMAGVRIEELLAGAAWMDGRTRAENLWENPAHLLGTALYLAETHKQRNVVAFMPFSDRLIWFGAWVAHLWAEALGKAGDGEGENRVTGQIVSPLMALTEQPAQARLCLEGPNDKVVLVLRVDDHGREMEVPAAYSDLETVSYLGGKGLGAVLNLEQRATEIGLQRGGRMAMTIDVPQVNAFTLGQLFHLFVSAAVFVAVLRHPNAAETARDDDGRGWVYGLLGRAGWEKRQAEVAAWLEAKRTQYVL